MTEPYVQEPAEEYGEQLHVDNQIEYNFTPLPNAVYAMWPHLGNDAFLVYILLVKFADRQTHICWPSTDTMRNLTGFGKNKLSRCIKVLREHNMVATHQLRKGREYGTNRYTLLPVKDWDMVSPIQGRHDRDAVTETPQRIYKQDPVKQDINKQDLKDADAKTRAREADYVEKVPSDSGLEEYDPGALTMSNGCAVYHPGFPCAHEQFALGEVSRLLWGKHVSLKSHPALHTFLHANQPLVGPPDDWEHVTMNQVRELATWWKVNRKPKDWTIPLMFSRPEETLATAQAAPEHSSDDPIARYMSRLTPEELGEA